VGRLRDLCYRHEAGKIGGVIKPGIDLSQAAVLSRKTGPPQMACVRRSRSRKERNMSLEFSLSSTLECYPLTILKSLALAGKLGRFTAHWRNPKVDSRKITKALADDLRDAPPMPVRWHCYAADRPPAGSLSWIECDGWAIDTGNAGPDRPVVILSASDYRNLTGATNIRLSAVI